MRLRAFSRSSILSMLLVTLVLQSFTSIKKSGCDNGELLSQAVDKLKKFTLLQQYPFYFKKAKSNKPPGCQKQMVTLSRGVRYKFYTVRNTEFDGLPVLALYNDEKMLTLLASTYNTRLDKFYNEIEFECGTTGNYCLSLYFKNGEEGCALGIFSSLITT